MSEVSREKLLTAIQQRQEVGRRTDLYLWFRDHAEEFSAVIERVGGTHSVSWSAVAGLMNEAGVVGRGGKPVTADMARKAWARVSGGKRVASARRSEPAVKPVSRGLNGGSGEAQASRFLEKLAGDGLPIPRPITRGE